MNKLREMVQRIIKEERNRLVEGIVLVDPDFSSGEIRAIQDLIDSGDIEDAVHEYIALNGDVSLDDLCFVFKGLSRNKGTQILRKLFGRI